MLASSNLEHDIQCKYIMIQLHCKDLSCDCCALLVIGIYGYSVEVMECALAFNA